MHLIVDQPPRTTTPYQINNSTLGRGQGRTYAHLKRDDVARQDRKRKIHSLKTIKELFAEWRQSYCKSESSVYSISHVINSRLSITNLSVYLSFQTRLSWRQKRNCTLTSHSAHSQFICKVNKGRSSYLRNSSNYNEVST